MKVLFLALVVVTNATVAEAQTAGSPPPPSSTAKNGHRAIWDHLAGAAAVGVVAARARGYCDGSGFDPKPVFGHVAAWSLLVFPFSAAGGTANPYTSRHTSTPSADRMWDAALVGAPFGALYGLLWAHDCSLGRSGDLVDRAPRAAMMATGAAIIGGVVLVLDILHKDGKPDQASKLSLRIGSLPHMSSVGLSISSRF